MFCILVAEDDKNLRRLMTAYLQGDGYQVYGAADGEEALQILESNKIDLLVCDIMMPGKDGYELTAAIRECDSELLILMVTARDTICLLYTSEELGISDFPITVRINKNTDERLLRRVSEVIRHGGGVIAVYNEELILQSLTEYGYPYSDAVNFANDGCWEVQIPGKTNFSYVPFDALAILQKQTLNSYDAPGFVSFEELYEHFIADLEKQVQQIHQNKTDEFLRCSAPCTVVSLFENDCISLGISYLEGGTVYTVVSPHIGGLADVANSLYAIKKIVFEEKLVSFSEFMAVLKPVSYTHLDVYKRQVLLSRGDKYCMIKVPVQYASGVTGHRKKCRWLLVPTAGLCLLRKRGEIIFSAFFLSQASLSNSTGLDVRQGCWAKQSSAESKAGEQG